jgi:REP element-mobilizing transposase RayT
MARGDLFDPAEVSVVHCINRCVRRCFLCGCDPLTGQNYEHRKAWLEERLAFLAGQFGIDVIGFAILSNHFHLVLRNRPDVVAQWSDTEVARRWLRLCPLRKSRTGELLEPTESELDTIRNVPRKLAEVRRRLSDVSWLMRMIAEPIARRANREDNVTGRFWQGRYKMVKLCDEAAVLACAVYVDLNPIRAAIAETLATSDFTSVQRRIESRRIKSARKPRPDRWLAPLPLDEANSLPGPQAHTGGHRASDKGFLPMSFDDYLRLAEWTARQSRRGCEGKIPAAIEHLLLDIGIAPKDWLPLIARFGRLFHRVAGAPLCEVKSRTRWQFRRGRAEMLGRR